MPPGGLGHDPGFAQAQSQAVGRGGRQQRGPALRRDVGPQGQPGLSRGATRAARHGRRMAIGQEALRRVLQHALVFSQGQSHVTLWASPAFARR
ncbi:hypothetical protein G6F31_019077 [Rhizopus arrhizus]|nr:hypothetical protein G6F31_019077 [Rhizopus arrhizus]